MINLGKRLKGVATAEVLLAFVQSWELHGSDETSICSGTLDLLRAYLGERPACVWKNTGPGLAKITERGHIALTIDLSPRFLDVLSGATRFQIVTTQPDGPTGQGFSLITMNLDRDKLSGIVRSCR